MRFESATAKIEHKGEPMAAFDRIASGMGGLDTVLDSFRLGDNIVWQVSDIDDYRTVAVSFARRALDDGRVLAYIRFARHAEILPAQEGLNVFQLDPAEGFEAFSGAIHDIVSQLGKDACYVFDSLSELEESWNTDLMMGNFFSVTCPYLFELDTVAHFALLRNRHSFETIARIRDTTQLLLDLYRDADDWYVHPLKVWKRYSPSMFFPHRFSPKPDGECLPLTDGVELARFYGALREHDLEEGNRNLDSWERFFLECRLATESARDEVYYDGMLNRLISPDPAMEKLLRSFISSSHLLSIKDRLIGSGRIGGKAVGMLAARHIVRSTLENAETVMEPHDSFYIGTDVFYTFLVHNNLWKLRMSQRKEDGYFNRSRELRDGIERGRFPDNLKDQFVRMLEYFGQSPIIVRSSSLLEDSFGHAFAGKYESVFCPNAGSPEDRLTALENAIRTVFASTMDESALAYRLDRGLAERDEQMALLVQRVSGTLYGDFYMPAFAGVGYSSNEWRWSADLEPGGSMLRIVLGLGTRAVDRTGGDYPRLMSPKKPALVPHADADNGRYAQRQVDGIDFTDGIFCTRELSGIVQYLPQSIRDLALEHDRKAEEHLRERGEYGHIWIANCSGLERRQDILGTLDAMLACLQREYGCPVDVEFTVNIQDDGEIGNNAYRVNILQCRPLQTIGEGLQQEVPHVKPEHVLFSIENDILGPVQSRTLDVLVHVDPIAYYTMPWKDKSRVARAVGSIGRQLEESGLAGALISPGRIGTTSPELGLPVTFADIKGFVALFEEECAEAGYQPELSYGSHFFQDLVEVGILYGALSDDPSRREREEALMSCGQDRDNPVFAQYPDLSPIIRLYRPRNLSLFADAIRGKCLCYVTEESPVK